MRGGAGWLGSSPFRRAPRPFEPGENQSGSTPATQPPTTQTKSFSFKVPLPSIGEA